MFAQGTVQAGSLERFHKLFVIRRFVHIASHAQVEALGFITELVGCHQHNHRQSFQDGGHSWVLSAPASWS